MVPAGHVPGVFCPMYAMPAIGRQHPPPHPRLHPDHVAGIDLRRREGECPGIRRNEPAIPDAAVIVPVIIERRTEALQEAHRAQARAGRRRGAAAQFVLDAADEDPQHPCRQCRMVAQRRPQALGQGQQPLPHRYPRTAATHRSRRTSKASVRRSGFMDQRARTATARTNAESIFDQSTGVNRVGVGERIHQDALNHEWTRLLD